MTKWVGLCVGGPLDGQWVTHPSTIMTVAVTSPVVVTPYDGVGEITEPLFTEHNYRFHELLMRGFWLPVEKDLGFLMEELMDKYWRYVDASK